MLDVGWSQRSSRCESALIPTPFSRGRGLHVQRNDVRPLVAAHELNQLTDVVPKPLLPVANRPVMAQGINCLHQLGIDDICVNVSYRAEQIMNVFGDGSGENVHLHWSIEEQPTGTAGGMKRLQAQLGDDRVVVIAGDAMLDVDLTLLLEAHIAHGAFRATLATTPVANPSLYGVVISEPNERIDHFQEKPAPGTEISRQANTGIYIFEPGIFDLIPAETINFALNVFPEILRLRLPFFAFPVHGYWTGHRQPRRLPQREYGFPCPAHPCPGAAA